jgi:hypothetical protein
MKLFLIAALLIHTTAHAICLNPLGCAPATQSECESQVAREARTEVGARAALAQCRRLPTHTKDECVKLSKSWVEHLRSTNGVEWTWNDRTSKASCRKNYPETFRPAAWITRTYCETSADRLQLASREVDRKTGSSIRLEQARVKNPEIAALDDESAAKVLRNVYYSDIPEGQFAALLFVDSPPDVASVIDICARLLVTSTR